MSEYLGPSSAASRSVPLQDVDFAAFYPHLFAHLPTPRLLTYNVRSYSCTAVSGKYKRRARRLKRNLIDVMRHADVVCIQETKMQTPDYYDSFKSEWFVFHNPYYTECDFFRPVGTPINTDTEDSEAEFSDRDRDFSDLSDISDDEEVRVHAAKAGTDIFVRKSYARNFELSHAVHRVGYIHSVSFTPLSHVSTSYPCSRASFSVVNAYIPNDTVEAASSALSCLANIGLKTDHTYAGGDWNIVVRPYDTTGAVSPTQLIDDLGEAMSKLRLHEVVSASKTRLSGETMPTMSRLDRWYTSLSEADSTLVGPEVWLPPHKYEPGMRCGSPSDHFPVLLQFGGCKSSKGLSRVPLWVARDPSFAAEIERRWDRGRKYETPCRKLRALDKLITTVAKEMTTEATSKTSTWVDAMALAVKILKDLKADRVQLSEAYDRCSRNSYLKDRIAEGDTASLVAKLETFVSRSCLGNDEASAYSKVKSVFSSTVNSYVPHPKTRRGANANVRAAVNTDRPRASFLVSDTGDRICDGEAMAELLRDAWEPIWSPRPFDEGYVDRYLSSYTKRLRRPVDEVSLDDVMAEIARPKSSCPGPDGIPFAAYAVICELAAPIFYDVIRHLMDGGKPLDDFNDVLLFFIPKDDTHKPAAHRPIAASNASNRIIANVLRHKLDPVIQELLEDIQTGFVHGRSIEEHIRFFNDKFYSSLYTRYPPTYPGPDLKYRYVEKGKVKWWDSSANPEPPCEEDAKHYHIFFIDFAKAYDNVSRKYLFRLLELIGVPRGYRNILWALFHNVHAIPAVGAKTKVRIPMLDGLKQGCPLSCLLFILAIDVLLMHANQVPEVDPRCFADDLAVGFRDWCQVAAVLDLVDEWSRAAGPVPNVKKTKFITTASLLGNYTMHLPPKWREVSAAETYVYLGVLIGAAVDVTMVYGAALMKFLNRVAKFMVLQDVLTLAERVRVANTYFVPILSYLHRFYIMPEYVRNRVNEALQRWLIKGTETNLKRLAAPRHAAGLHSPLRDPYQVNVASVLRGAGAEAEGARREIGSYTMLIDDHVLKAAEEYEKVVGGRYRDQATQAEHFLALQHADPAPLTKLGDTLLERAKRHPELGPPGKFLDIAVRTCMSLPNSINESLRNHAFQLIHNLLFVGDRYKGEARRERDISCVLCGDPLETVRHVFCDCPVTKLALADLTSSTEPATRRLAALLRAASAEEYLLRVPLESKKAVVLLTFTRAVWRARRKVEGGSLSAKHIARLISGNFVAFYRHRYGWTVRDRELEKRIFLCLLAALPSVCTAVYTDGSSFGNPGPAGSGYAVYEDGELVADASHHLGIATNGYAELHAVLMATTALRDSTSGKPVFFFVDNVHTIRLMTGITAPSWGAEEVRVAIDNLKVMSASRRVAFYWVPGHAGVPGNERADRNAKRGARGTGEPRRDGMPSPSAGDERPAPPSSLSSEVSAAGDAASGLDDEVPLMPSNLLPPSRRGGRANAVYLGGDTEVTPTFPLSMRQGSSAADLAVAPLSVSDGCPPSPSRCHRGVTAPAAAPLSAPSGPPAAYAGPASGGAKVPLDSESRMEVASPPGRPHASRRRSSSSSTLVGPAPRPTLLACPLPSSSSGRGRGQRAITALRMAVSDLEHGSETESPRCRFPAQPRCNFSRNEPGEAPTALSLPPSPPSGREAKGNASPSLRMDASNLRRLGLRLILPGARFLYCCVVYIVIAFLRAQPLPQIFPVRRLVQPHVRHAYTT